MGWQDADLLDAGSEAKESGVVGRFIGDVDELAARTYPRAERLGEVVVRGFQRRPDHLRANRRDPAAKHVPAGIVMHERDGRATVELRKALTQ